MSSTGDAHPAPARLVLDTNVVLDLFLFADRRVAALADAVAQGQALLITEPDCLEELRRVLRYPAFALGEKQGADLIDRYRNCCAGAGVQQGSPALPLALRCRDPDDQKFLMLAWRSGAMLLTRDKALLVLRRRFIALGGVGIGLPESAYPPAAQNQTHSSAFSVLGHNFASARAAAPPESPPVDPKHPEEI